MALSTAAYRMPVNVTMPSSLPRVTELNSSTSTSEVAAKDKRVSRRSLGANAQHTSGDGPRLGSRLLEFSCNTGKRMTNALKPANRRCLVFRTLDLIQDIAATKEVLDVCLHLIHLQHQASAQNGQETSPQRKERSLIVRHKGR